MTEATQAALDVHSAPALFYAEAVSYEQFHASLRRRAEELNVSRATLDARTGLADGLSGKALAPKPLKSVIGKLSLEPFLRVLGLRLIIVADPDTPAARGELPQRNATRVRLNTNSRRSKGRRKPKAKSVRVKKPAKPRHEKPYLANLLPRRATMAR